MAEVAGAVNAVNMMDGEDNEECARGEFGDAMNEGMGAQRGAGGSSGSSCAVGRKGKAKVTKPSLKLASPSSSESESGDNKEGSGHDRSSNTGSDSDE